MRRRHSDGSSEGRKDVGYLVRKLSVGFWIRGASGSSASLTQISDLFRVRDGFTSYSYGGDTVTVRARAAKSPVREARSMSERDKGGTWSASPTSVYSLARSFVSTWPRGHWILFLSLFSRVFSGGQRVTSSLEDGGLATTQKRLPW
jgi:hypothetical protein